MQFVFDNDNDAFTSNGQPTEQAWAAVSEYVEKASAICFDGCHKIYVLMDQTQVHFMRSGGYAYTIEDPDVETIRQWYDDSCGLRFIEAVRTVDGDPNNIDGFTKVIPQYFP